MNTFVLIISQIIQHQYTTESLELTSKLLRWNPEYYTIWNHRRLILQHLLSAHPVREDDTIDNFKATANLISDDLAFLIPLLRKFPKCYWIWNYRLWLLEEATRRLPPEKVRKSWQQELALAGKVLSLDSRNFHGWGYRRTVIAALESDELQNATTVKTMTEQEFEYTTKMINSNLSNFSAWHNRSKLIPRLLDERAADGAARRKFLNEGRLLFGVARDSAADLMARARAYTASTVGGLRGPVALVLSPVSNVHI